MLWKGTWKCGGGCINGVVGDTSMQHGIMPYQVENTFMAE